jgi:hypothetical protein
MKEDDLDRILSEEEEVVPSSGFLAAVMEAVQHEAAEPPPIPFPWRRALPGFAVAVLILVFSTVAGFATSRHGIPIGPLPFSLPSGVALVNQAAQEVRAGWIALALAVSFASMKLPALFALRRT